VRRTPSRALLSFRESCLVLGGANSLSRGAARAAGKGMRGRGVAGGGGEADGEMLVFRLHVGVVLAVRRHAVGGGASACAEVGLHKQKRWLL